MWLLHKCSRVSGVVAGVIRVLFEDPEGLGQINVSSGSPHCLRSQNAMQVLLTEW